MRRYYNKQRKAVVEALKCSDLMKIGKVHNINVGTHLLLSVDSRLSDDEIAQKAQKLGMHIAMLSDYCIYPSVQSSHYVVINFASIEPDQVKTAASLLERVFAQDISTDLK